MGAIVVATVLSALWIAAGIHDLRTQRISNLISLPAAALALGYQAGRGAMTGAFLFSWIGGCLFILALWRGGLFGGGDAKMVMGLLAWCPRLETWLLVAFWVAAFGLGAIAWYRFRRRIRPDRYPLAGAIALAGLVLVWGPLGLNVPAMGGVS